MAAEPEYPFNLTGASGSDPGLIRKSNEDSVFAYIRPDSLGEPLGIFIVADGMGGHQAGEVASQLAVDTIYKEMKRYLERDDNQDTIPIHRPDKRGKSNNGQTNYVIRRLRAAILDANLAIHKYSLSHPLEAGNLGTTVAAVVVKGKQAIIGNVGDSRVYLLRDTNLNQLTEDHSLVHHLVENGQLEPDDVYDHPHRSIITRALGFNPDVAVDIFTENLDIGDRILVCSDGLWEMIREDDEIVTALSTAGDPAAGVEQLIGLANKYGGVDNIGVVLCELVPNLEAASRRVQKSKRQRSDDSTNQQANDTAIQ
jgi:serine/threonine protein phosphatase PrpC